jgi:RimJ/RimL family protein N-acetyltransferase
VSEPVPPESLVTERLVLRGFRSTDVEALAPMYADPAIVRLYSSEG